MFDFRPARPTGRNYLARGEQRRLLVMVLVLGFVAATIGESARPGNWEWLWLVTQGRPSGPASIDTRLALAQIDAPVAKDVAAPAGEGANGPWATVSLKGLLDDSRFRGDERPAVYAVLRQLADTPAAEVAAASLGPVSFVQLYKQGSAYRGRVVECSGIVRRAVRVPVQPASAPPEANALPAEAIEPAAALREFFELWLTPTERPAELLVVYCTELPAGLVPGEALNVPVKFHAVSLKRLAYQDQEREWRSTPLLAARRVDLAPVAAAGKPAERRRNFGWVIPTTALVVAVAILAGGLAWWASRRPRQRNPYATAHKSAQRGLEFADLRTLEVDADVRAALEKLDRKDHDAANH